MLSAERLPVESPSPSRDHVVLCVDDEVDTLEALRRALRNERYFLITTTRPEQALTWVEERDISLVISDQRMPLMTGTRLLQGVRDLSPTTLCAVLTAYPGSVLTGGRPDYGIRELIVKPWDDLELKRIILRLLLERERGRGVAESDREYDMGGEGG